jgi:hypothetical protein
MEVFNVRQIRRINCHLARNDEDSDPENILNTENWLDWNGDQENPTDSEDNWEADNESEIELDHSMEHSKTPAQRDVSVVHNIPGLIKPTWKWKKNSEQVLMMVDTMET